MFWLISGDVVDTASIDYSLFGVSSVDVGSSTSCDVVVDGTDACSGSSVPSVVPSGPPLVRFVSVRVPVSCSLPVSSNELSFRDYCCSHTFIHSGCVLVVLAA